MLRPLGRGSFLDHGVMIHNPMLWIMLWDECCAPWGMDPPRLPCCPGAGARPPPEIGRGPHRSGWRPGSGADRPWGRAARSADPRPFGALDALDNFAQGLAGKFGALDNFAEGLAGKVRDQRRGHVPGGDRPNLQAPGRARWGRGPRETGRPEQCRPASSLSLSLSLVHSLIN